MARVDYCYTAYLRRSTLLHFLRRGLLAHAKHIPRHALLLRGGGYGVQGTCQKLVDTGAKYVTMYFFHGHSLKVINGRVVERPLMTEIDRGAGYL